MKKRKVNPKRHVITAYDLNKAKKEAEVESVKAAWAIMFSILRDKYDWSVEQLQKLWEHVNDFSESIVKGYISIDDLVRVLAEEDDIHLY